MSSPKSTTSSDWYENAFGADYLQVYGHRSPEEATEQVRWLTKSLGLSPESRVLDCACGNGRHVAALHALQIPSFGADLSPELLSASRAMFGPLPLTRHDMRALPFLEGSFTHALSLFTSFGYFYTEEEHLLVLSEVARILVPGGTLLLDFMNASLTIKHLKAKTTRTLGPSTVTETRSYDEVSRRINKRIEIKEAPTEALAQEPETRTFFESVRAFNEQELAALLQRAGFTVESLAGDFEGAPYSESSSRLIVTARSSGRPSDKKSST